MQPNRTSRRASVRSWRQRWSRSLPPWQGSASQMAITSAFPPAAPGAGLAKTRGRVIAAISAAARVADAFRSACVAAAFTTPSRLKLQPAKQYSVLFNESARPCAPIWKQSRSFWPTTKARTASLSRRRGWIPNARLGELSSQLHGDPGTTGRDKPVAQHDYQAGGDSRPESSRTPLIPDLKSDLILAEAKQRELSTQSAPITLNTSATRR